MLLVIPAFHHAHDGYEIAVNPDHVAAIAPDPREEGRYVLHLAAGPEYVTTAEGARRLLPSKAGMPSSGEPNESVKAYRREQAEIAGKAQVEAGRRIAEAIAKLL